MAVRKFAIMAVSLAAVAQPPVTSAWAQGPAINAEQAAANASVHLWERVCHEADRSGTIAFPSNTSGIQAFSARHDVRVGMPAEYEGLVAGSALFANAQLYSRGVAGYTIVLQLRDTGSCRVYVMGPHNARRLINRRMVEAIEGSPLRWQPAGEPRPGPNGVSGQMYAIAGENRPYGVFYVDGGPPDGPILAVISISPRSAIR